MNRYFEDCQHLHGSAEAGGLHVRAWALLHNFRPIRRPSFPTVLVLFVTVLSVGVMFSAIIAERRAELGLLLALGTLRRQLVRLILAEAMIVTTLGGLGGLLLGAGLLLLFRRSLGYYFETVDVPVLWPAPGVVALTALGCGLLATCVGLLGAAVPAWRASRQEPYELVRS